MLTKRSWVLVGALLGLGACVLSTETVSRPEEDGGPDAATLAALQAKIGALETKVGALEKQSADPGSLQTLVDTVAAQQKTIATLQAEVDAVGNTTNVRGFFSKAVANSYCAPLAKASYVPWTWRGRTGNDICASDSKGALSCDGVKQVVVTSNNSLSDQPKYDKPCGAPLDTPWPWGADYQIGGVFDEEWHHGDVDIVCCK